MTPAACTPFKCATFLIADKHCVCSQEEFRRAAIACLTQRLQVSLASAAQQASAETEQLLETQTELAQRGAHLQVAVRFELSYSSHPDINADVAGVARHGQFVRLTRDGPCCIKGLA
jgi:hypothetical protein